MYGFELAGFDATLRGDFYYRGKKLFRSENNERPTPTNRFLNLKLLLARDNYEVGVFAQNVTDAIAPLRSVAAAIMASTRRGHSGCSSAITNSPQSAC